MTKGIFYSNSICSIVIVIVFLLLFLQSNKCQTASIYTEISNDYCKSTGEGVGNGILHVAECKGVGGYKIGYSEGEDYHQFLDLISADGKNLGIDVTKLSIAPANIGKTLEWRVTKKGKNIKPFALIFRFNIYREGINEPDKMESLLVIAKITKDAACITDTVKPYKNQNIKARILADISGKKPCFQNDY